MKEDNPFDEKKLKKKLKIVTLGYGEKRDSRMNLAIEKTVREKATLKCARYGISLNECVDQLLYIWSKDEKLEKVDPDQLKFDTQEGHHD